MSDNTHPAVAKFRQEGVHEWQSDEGLTDATGIATILDAQVEATLALVHEQRTANLIAYAAILDKVPAGVGGPAFKEKCRKITTEIEERLDLP